MTEDYVRGWMDCRARIVTMLTERVRQTVNAHAVSELLHGGLGGELPPGLAASRKRRTRAEREEAERILMVVLTDRVPRSEQVDT